MNNTMIMTVGIPGCGKSTYTKNIQEEKGYLVFSSDVIRAEYKEKGMEITNQTCFQELHKRIKQALLSGKDCIYDATNLSRKFRMAFLQEIKNIPCKKVCVLFIVPIEVCKERNNLRTGDARVPEEVYDRMLRSFNTPYYYEGFDEIKTILYDKAFEIDDFKNLDDFSQDNRHHTLTLGQHMKKTKEYFIDAGFDYTSIDEILLKQAADYHDIGKVYTKDFHNRKGEPTEEAHYYGHENYGAYLYLVQWLAFPEWYNFEEALYIANLINWHMSPYTVWKESERRKFKDKLMLSNIIYLGCYYNMYEHIMLLHKADVLAH